MKEEGRGKKEDGRGGRGGGGEEREKVRNNEPRRHGDTKEEENFPISPSPQSLFAIARIILIR
jgi:hypothetical protein